MRDARAIKANGISPCEIVKPLRSIHWQDVPPCLCKANANESGFLPKLALDFRSVYFTLLERWLRLPLPPSGAGTIRG